MPDIIITDDALESKVSHLLEGIPASFEWVNPERANELPAMLEGLQALLIQADPSRSAFYAPAEKTIVLSTRLFEVLWAQSYGYSLFYSEKLAGVDAQAQRVRLDDSDDLREAGDLLRWAASQMRREFDEPWPSQLPSQEDDVPKPERVARQQSLIALNFIFHHELGHHRLGHKVRDIEHEKDADAAAADWLLDGYDSADETRRVRALGASVALLYLACRGVHTGHHGAEAHPAGYNRLLHCLDRQIEPDDIDVWSFVGMMLDLHMQAVGQTLERQECGTWREWCDVLVDHLSRQ